MVQPRDPYRILQISELSRPDDLESARATAQRRYVRLTSRGPLRFYRRDLLIQCDRAYEQLRPASNRAASASMKSRPTISGTSVLQRQAQKQGLMDLRTPVRSQVKSGSLLGHQPLALKSRSVAVQRATCSIHPPHPSHPVHPPRSSRQQALIEDDFCREVLYRLEGDLIRYRHRQELLELARFMGLHAFRANFLIAQIVECVRRRGSSAERSAGESSRHKKAARRDGAVVWSWPRLRNIAALVFLVLFLFLDAWLILKLI